MNGGPVERVLGGSPLGVVLRLLLLSLLVGFLLSYFGLTPGALLAWAQSQLARLWRQGFSAVRDIGSWVALGALVVLPIWIVGRLLSRRR